MGSIAESLSQTRRAGQKPVKDQAEILRGWRVLIVEDDYMIASDLAAALRARGAELAGPVGSLTGAVALVTSESGRIDAAVLDVNLGAEQAYPVADLLAARGVPFVFATGYDAWVIPQEYLAVPRFEKPVDTAALARYLADMRTR